MEGKQQLLVPFLGGVGEVPLGVPVRIGNTQEISENLTTLNPG